MPMSGNQGILVSELRQHVNVRHALEEFDRNVLQHDHLELSAVLVASEDEIPKQPRTPG